MDKVSSTKSSKSSYRPEIDGLRAIAVVAVLIYHFNPDWLPSGFLGVDIFFVISGFVVTSSLSNKPDQSWKSYLSTFYSKRVKRLFPALVTCVVLTSIIGCFFIFEPGHSLKTGISALFGVSNIYLFIDSTNYFGQSAEFNLFTQTWSLGVEEQFYLLFPLLLGVCGFSRKRTYKGERNLFLAVLGLSVLSFIGYIFLAQTNFSAAFFLMPSRFWELGIGCLTFLIFNRFSRRSLGFLAPLCTLLIVLILFLSKDFQTLTTITTAFLTAILLWAFDTKSFVVEILSLNWVVKIGKLSYSLYLWHWSVIVLSKWTVGVNNWTIPFQLLLIIVLAMISYHFIETPLRYLQWSTSNFKNIGYGLGTSFASVILLLGLGNPLDGKLYSGKTYPDANLVSFKLSKDFKFCWYGLSKSPNFGDCAYPPIKSSSAKPKTVYFVGDSHNMSLQALASRLVEEEAVPRIVMVVQHACFFSPSLVREENSFVEPDKCRNSVRSFLSEVLEVGQKGDVVIVTNRYKPIFQDPNYAPDIGNYSLVLDGVKLTQNQALDTYMEELENIAGQLSDKGMSLVVQAPLPDWKHLPQECDDQWFRLSIPATCELSAQTESKERQTVIDSFRKAESTSSNLHIYDPFSVFCNSKNCSQFVDGKPLFRDDNHLNNDGAEYLYDEFKEFLEKRKLL